MMAEPRDQWGRGRLVAGLQGVGRQESWGPREGQQAPRTGVAMPKALRGGPWKVGRRTLGDRSEGQGQGAPSLPGPGAPREVLGKGRGEARGREASWRSFKDSVSRGLGPPSAPASPPPPWDPSCRGPVLSAHVHGCPAKPNKLQPSGLRPHAGSLPHAVSGHSRGNRGLGSRSRGGP